MGDKDDGLVLSLGLSCVPTQQQQQQQQQQQKTKTDNNGQISLKFKHFKNPWHDLFPHPEMNSDGRSFLRGIDMNKVADCVDENGVSSPNSTISSVSGKRIERETCGDETEAERASCSPGSDDEDDGGGDGNRKKLRLSKDQSLILEETFKEHNTLNHKQKLGLAKQLNLRPRQVEVWFQNRRARTKLKQTEVDCEFLKRCYENLTEENRKLQKEVQELRVLKLSPQLYTNMNPPTTLTMCPSCERVAVSSSSSPLSSSTAAATSSARAGSAAATCLTMAPNNQRSLQMVSWSGLPIHHRPVDAPSRS